MPRDLRPAFSALWNLDLAFADVVATSSDSRLGAIRMAWWRERLEELDQGKQAPAEPRLVAIAEQLLPRGVSGAELSGLEDAWAAMLEPFPWTKAAADGLELRGRILFGIGARLLGEQSDAAETAGALWSLIDCTQHCSDRASSDYLRSEAKSAVARLPRIASRSLRTLTVLAALSATDLLGGGGFARLVAALRHRLRGAFPRG